MRPIPEALPILTPHLVVRDARAALDHYRDAFGARETSRILGPDGRVMFAEMSIGDARIFVVDEATLGGKTLIRRGGNDSPQGHHEDLMIVFPAANGLRASYFDNEGHTINYAVTPAGDHVEPLSDAVPGAPRFRLTYDLRGSDELAIDFGIAPPGSSEFKHYTGGIVHRVR